MWRWLVSTLDDDVIELGLNRIAQREAAELQPKCARLAQVEKLIESTDNKIRRLVRDLSEEDDAGRWLDVSWGVSEGVNSVPIVKKILSPIA